MPNKKAPSLENTTSEQKPFLYHPSYII